MAKQKNTAKDTIDLSDPLAGATLVEDTLQDNDFSAPEEAPPAFEPGAYHEIKNADSGKSVADSMRTIREERARIRATRGPVRKRRVITSYLDAERLHRLATGANEGGHRNSEGRRIRGSVNHFPGIATPEELVDAEEAGLMPNPEHYATGTQGEIDGWANPGDDQ